MKFTTTAAVALAALVASAACAQQRLALYDASLGGMPEDAGCWNYLASNNSITPPANVDNLLHLGPTNNGGNYYWRQELYPFLFTDGPASITASVRVNSSSYYAVNPYKRSGYYISLSDSANRRAQLGISSDRVLLHTGDANWSDQTYLFNTVGAFHTYRLEFNGNTVVASIDGVPVLTDTVGSIGNGAAAFFGDASGLANSNTDTAWVEVEGVTDCAQGDLDCSGAVDGFDLGLLLGAWNTDACAADLNFDGTVNGGDLGILLGNWG